MDAMDTMKVDLPEELSYRALLPLQTAPCRPKTNRDWDEQRLNIERLYVIEDMTLPEVMKAMEESYGFKATYVHRLVPTCSAFLPGYFFLGCGRLTQPPQYQAI